MEVCDQLVLLFAAVNGYLDRIPVSKVTDFEKELYSYLQNAYFYLAFSLHILDNFDTSLFNFILEHFTKEFTIRYA